LRCIREGIDEWWEFPTTYKLFRIKIVLRREGVRWRYFELYGNEWWSYRDENHVICIFTQQFTSLSISLYTSLFSSWKMPQVERLKPQSTIYSVLYFHFYGIKYSQIYFCFLEEIPFILLLHTHPYSHHHLIHKLDWSSH
jgi:hypothetical protein